MGITPLFNIHITPASTLARNKAADLGANRFLALTGMSFMTAFNCFMKFGGANKWGDADVGPYWLEICRDSAKVIAGTADPLWIHEITNVVADQWEKNLYNFWQPLVGSTFQFHIRRTLPWPNGTVLANGDWDEFTLLVLGHPPQLVTG